MCAVSSVQCVRILFFQKLMNKNDSEIIMQFCSPNFISLAWKAKKLGKTCTVRPLCAPCAPTVQPLCNSLRNLLFDHCLTTVWPRPFWNWFGILLHKVQGILLHKIKRYCSTHKEKADGILLHHIFRPFCRGHLFFQQAAREGSDQKNFLPMVPNFKSDHSGWLRYPTLSNFPNSQ